jgi:hypothetical protein
MSHYLTQILAAWGASLSTLLFIVAVVLVLVIKRRLPW